MPEVRRGHPGRIPEDQIGIPTPSDHADALERRRVQDMGYLLADPRGRRFLGWLLRECGLYSKIPPPMASEALQRYAGALALGQRVERRIMEQEPGIMAVILAELDIPPEYQDQ